MQEILVSIICNTYNQEDYIEQTIKGFLMQKTKFPFEILIHDDASTDSTSEIVSRYQEKYPNLIKAIIQKENQYSKKVAITEVFQVPRAKGKYIALCEGDDYWTDPLKLQKQVDALEQNPNIDVCSHRAEIHCDEKPIDTVPKYSKDKIFSVDEVILGDGGFVATASLLFRKEWLTRGYKFAQIFSLDYAWQIGGALKGGMLYLSDIMCVYRKQAKNSWSKTVANNTAVHLDHWNYVKQILSTLDEETNHKHSKAINTQLAIVNLKPTIKAGDVKALFSDEVKKHLASLPFKKRIFTILLTVRRRLINVIKK